MWKSPAVKILVAAVVVAVLIVLANSLFVVTRTQQALVLQFGEVRRVAQEPGLKMHLPFLQNVVFYDKRVLSLSPPPFEVLLSDKKRIIMDSYARYRIDDPVLFYERVREEPRLNDLLGRSMNSGLRRVVATVSLTELLSDQRDSVMKQILATVKNQAETFGIEVMDVRFSRTDLPPQTSQAVYSRMRAEREREAREARAEGKETAQKIRAQAEKERTILIATARGDASRIHGEAEAQTNQILSSAYSVDTEFYRFYESLEKYRSALTDGRSLLVFDTNGDFFRYFEENSRDVSDTSSATVDRSEFLTQNER